MNFKAGKYYRRRDGKKFYLAAILPPNPWTGQAMSYPLIGFTEGFAVGDTRLTIEGLMSSGHRCSADLVAEWREPVSRTCKLIMYRHCDSYIVRIDGQCPPIVYEACGSKEITITEGEGMT